MLNLAKLSVDLFLNSSKFEKGTSRAGKAFTGLSKAIKSGVKVATGAIVALGGSMLFLAKRQAGVIDETAKLSRALGVNIREFQALALVASESAISQDQLGNIITKSQRSIVEAARGLETYSRSFKTLNLDVKELVELSPEKQFQAILNALEKVENPTLRTATALEIFGRSGRQVINMLGNLQDNVDEARSFNDKFNISLNEIDAAKVEEANDTFGRVKEAIGGLGNTIAISLAPVVTALSQAFLDGGVSAASFAETASKSMRVVFDAVDQVRVALLGLRAIQLESRINQADNILNAGDGQIKGRSGAKIQFEKLKAEAELSRIRQGSAKFIPIAEKIGRIETEANARAKQSVKINRDKAAAAREALELIESQTKGTTKLTDAEKERIDNAKELGLTFTSAFEDAVTSGNKLSDVLKGLAQDIQKIILRRAVTEPLGDLISGSLGRSGGGGLLSSIFGGSFATGIDKVPRDMIATVHKGEKIIPAQQVRAMERDTVGDTMTVNQTINVSTGVQQTVQAEIKRLLPSIAKASGGAVSEQNSRNKINLGA